MYPNQWSSFFDNLGKQGDQFNALLSKSNQYYAFLSKVDLINEKTKKYDVFFELINREWADNALFSSTASINKLPTKIPAVAYHLPEVDETELLKILNLKSTDYLAEGSWYLIQLEKGATGPLVGDLYDPDIDMPHSS